MKWMILTLVCVVCIGSCKTVQTPSETRQAEIKDTIKVVEDDKTIQPATKVLIRSTLSGAAADLKMYADKLIALEKENGALINRIADMDKYYRIGKYSVYALYTAIAGVVAWVIWKVVSIFRPKLPV